MAEQQGQYLADCFNLYYAEHDPDSEAPPARPPLGWHSTTCTLRRLFVADASGLTPAGAGAAGGAGGAAAAGAGGAGAYAVRRGGVPG
eukprot:SAG11_NODE_791_length_7146_cov_49.170427_3_plen_88_part_00